MADFVSLPVPVRAKLVRSVPLIFCTVQQYRDDYFWTWTQFPDGSGYGAQPDYSEDGRERYADLARRLGYQSVDDYCFEHEFAHSFVEQEIAGRASPVLWSLAHKRRHPDHTVYEEAVAQAFQGFMRADIPMTATAPDVDWYRLRDKALWLLALAANPVRDPAAAAALR